MKISIRANLLVVSTLLTLPLVEPLFAESFPAGSGALMSLSGAFYESHKSLAWGMAIVVCVLSGLVLLLVIAIIRMREFDYQLRQAKLIVENSPAVLFRWEPSTGWPVEFVSENVAQFGYKPEILMEDNVPYSTIIYPEDLSAVVSKVEGYASRGEDRFNLEYRIVTGENQIRWVEERTIVERDKHGTIVCYQGIVIDVTERKLSEEELLLSKFCLDNAEIGIFHTSEHQIFSANDYACKSLGYSLDELRRLRISDIDPVITDEKIHTIKKSLDLAGSATHQTVHRRKDGTTFPVEITASNVEFHGKQYTISFVQDITERRRSEDALRESEEKFRVLAETSPAAIALYQGDDVLYINPTAAELIGYTVEELSKISFWGCVHEDFKEMVRERGLARMRGEPVPTQYECKFVSKEGKELWAIVSVGRIEFKGKPAGIVTIIDTTEAKLAEERIRASLREKEVLLKEVHHRVKNNLQIVSSLIDLQSGYIHDEQSRAFFQDSQNRIRSMALIHQKLYQSESLAFIDLREYIEDLVAHLLTTGAQNPDSIRLNVQMEDIPLGMDEAIPCGLIVNELVSNSLQHAFPDNRGGEIVLNCRSADGWIELTVSDNGIGLPPALDFRKTETLGLQLVTTLVKQLRGQIDIASESGGTVVSIRFPSCCLL